jgi:hypothetical protein
MNNIPEKPEPLKPARLDYKDGMWIEIDTHILVSGPEGSTWEINPHWVKSYYEVSCRYDKELRQHRAEGENNIDEVRYLTDDRDSYRKNELVINRGGNGDWYVATVPEGAGTVGRSVRICTSGGAATAVPGLGVAISEAFRALLAAIKQRNE